MGGSGLAVSMRSGSSLVLKPGSSRGDSSECTVGSGLVVFMRSGSSLVLKHGSSCGDGSECTVWVHFGGVEVEHGPEVQCWRSC